MVKGCSITLTHKLDLNWLARSIWTEPRHLLCAESIGRKLNESLDGLVNFLRFHLLDLS